MFDCLDLSFKHCFHGSWPLVNGTSHLEDQWPTDDRFMMYGWSLMFMYGFTMIGDEMVKF